MAMNLSSYFHPDSTVPLLTCLDLVYLLPWSQAKAEISFPILSFPRIPLFLLLCSIQALRCMYQDSYGCNDRNSSHTNLSKKENLSGHISSSLQGRSDFKSDWTQRFKWRIGAQSFLSTWQATWSLLPPDLFYQPGGSSSSKIKFRKNFGHVSPRRMLMGPAWAMYSSLNQSLCHGWGPWSFLVLLALSLAYHGGSSGGWVDLSEAHGKGLFQEKALFRQKIGEGGPGWVCLFVTGHCSLVILWQKRGSPLGLDRFPLCFCYLLLYNYAST